MFDGLVRPSRLVGSASVIPPHDSLVAAFEAVAHGGAPFFTVHNAQGASSKTARASLEGALAWAKLLTSRGLRRHDCVLVLLPTGHGFVEAMVGVMLAGGTPVPLATPMTFGSVDRYLQNLAGIAGDCGARMAITYGRLRASLTDANGAGARFSGILDEVLGEEDLAGMAKTPFVSPSIGASDTAFLQYTSGTTGAPKGTVISHGALVANAFSISSALGLGATDVGVSWLPLFHDMGLIGVLLTSICHPYPVHVMSPESFVMNPRRWLELIANVGGTITAAPNFAYDMAVARAGQTPDLRLESLRCALNGAELVQQVTLDRFAERFSPHGFSSGAFLPVYGMAEATLAVTFTARDEGVQTCERRDLARSVDDESASARREVGSYVGVGSPVAGMKIEIVGDGGTAAPEGSVGEIRVAGPSLMDGYFRNERASAEAIRDGWLMTGDLGFVHEGRLFVTGRAKELIIKAGRNLHPHGVERVACEVDGVRRGGVAAFGRVSERTGTEELVVVVETTQADPDRRESIAKAVRAELLDVLGVKADAVHLCGVGKVPRTTSGKIRRRECARLVSEGTLG